MLVQGRDTNQFAHKHLKYEMENLPFKDSYDPNFRRVKYVRYADDFLIGLIAPKAYAVDLKQKIKEFLKNELCLRLSNEKTKITHATDSDVTFLGYIIRKGAAKHGKFQTNPFDSTIRIYMNTDGILKSYVKTECVQAMAIPLVSLASLENHRKKSSNTATRYCVDS